MWKTQKSQISEKEKQVDFKVCNTAKVIRTVWVAVDKQIDQWTSTKSPEIVLCVIYGPLIFDKYAMPIQWRINSIFPQLLLEIWISICKKQT